MLIKEPCLQQDNSRATYRSAIPFGGRGSRWSGARGCHISVWPTGHVIFLLAILEMDSDSSLLPVLSEIHCRPWGEKRENPDEAPVFQSVEK